MICLLNLTIRNFTLTCEYRNVKSPQTRVLNKTYFDNNNKINREYKVELI